MGDISMSAEPILEYYDHKFYAGIGSRKTPQDVQEMMTAAAALLSEHDLILRSGGADGADTAFELGADPKKKEIYLPWKGFNQNPSNIYGVSDEALHVASFFHPNWNNLKTSVRILMGRNSHQVLGPFLKHPVLFVLCWTPNGDGSGGTGQAISLAEANQIPVFDMGSMSIEEIGNKIQTYI